MASLGIVVFLLCLTVLTVSSERMKDKIYDSIDGAAACFRRLNGTHQFGCSSEWMGNVGVVHVVESEANLTWLLDNGEASPYMVVLRPNMFTKDILQQLKKSGKINGIVLLNNGTADRPGSFSHEDQCPNRYSGLSSLNNQTCRTEDSWNPQGSGVLLMDWNFPIFYVNTEPAISKLYRCYLNFNSNGLNQRHDRSLCAIQMKSFMYAAVNSATCFRRSSMITNFNPVKFCDPLGDRNVWSTLFPRNKSLGLEQNDSVIVVSTRLDTSSMFDGVTPGALSPVTGIVALLATAQMLSALLPTNESYSQNVMFTLLNGESFDYIGSSRMLWDMGKGVFPVPVDSDVKDQPPPLKMQHLGLFVELDQLVDQYKRTLVFHYPNKNDVKVTNSVFTFTNKMGEVGKRFNLSFEVAKDDKLPPASLQTFLAQEKSLPGVVVASYEKPYNYKYYHGIFDDSNSLGYTYNNGSEPSTDSIQSFVANFSTTLAYTLYFLVTGSNYTGSTAVDVNMVDELFHCYLDQVNCSIFNKATASKQGLINKTAGLYVGVNTWHSQNAITALTAQTLAFLTGTSVNRTENDCKNDPQQQIYQYIWMTGNSTENETGVCIQTTMNFSQASSPAFEISDYDWTSGQYSTWTESVWQELTVRIFLKPSRSHENMILSVGATVLILAFLIVYFLNARSNILFGNTLITHPTHSCYSYRVWKRYN